MFSFKAYNYPIHLIFLFWNIIPRTTRYNIQCGHNQKNTDTEEKKENTENTES